MMIMVIPLSCSRFGFYDMAKNGVPVIYATTMGPTNAEIIIAGEDGILGQYPVTGFVSPAADDIIVVDARYRVMIANVLDLYYSDDRDYTSPWTQVAPPGTIADLAAVHDEVYGIITGSTSIYKFDDMAGNLINTGNTIGESAEKLFFSEEDEMMYICGNNGGNGSIYAYKDGPSLPFLLISAVAPPRIFFARINGNFYLGNCTEIRRNNDTPMASGSGIQSYAVLEDGRIFAAGLMGTLKIVKVSGGAPEDVYTSFTSNTGTIKLAPFSPEYIAVAVSGATIDDGLYLFNVNNNTIRKITPPGLQAFSLYVR
jgi:hypothetical protein